MDRVDYQPLVVQDLANLHKATELNLNPWYQRRAVWTRPQKAYLINTLFEQKPVPSCYIRHYLDIDTEKSIKEVVDGQQRIRAILEYVANEFSARHPNHKKRVKYDELSKDEKTAFRMTSLSIGYLINADDSDVIEIFGRLNAVAKTLNAQEKRNAKFGGEVKQFSLREAAKRVRLWRDLGVFTANDIARMTEVEFVSDITLNLLDGLSDFSAAKLDAFYKKYDEEFADEDTLSSRLDKVFTKIASLEPPSIRDTIFSRSPLFFSLVLLLDSLNSKVPKAQLEDGLYKADKSFNSDKPISERTRSEANFYVACTASTQRIRSRKIRDEYLRKVFQVK